MPRQRKRETSPEIRFRNMLEAGGLPAMAGRSRVGVLAARPEALHPSVIVDPTAGVDASLSGTPRLLVLSATGDSIADGGDYVTFGVPVLRHGFPTVSTTSWTHPTSGEYVLVYEHTWASYADGGTIELEIDGAVPTWGTICDGTSGQVSMDVLLYIAEAGQVGKIKVTQSSGSAQTAAARLQVGISDPTTTTLGDALLITEGIAARPASPTGETFFDETFSFDWNGLGSVVLSLNNDGTGAPGVDDRLTVDVTHEDASTASWDQPLPPVALTNPVDITSYLETGTNSIRIRFRDYYGTNVEAYSLWLVQLGG